jgi:potassium efflux system protein
MRLFVRLWLLIALLVAVAATAQPLPTPASLKSRLDALGASKLPEAEQAQARQALEAAIEHMGAAEAATTELDVLRKTLEEAPAQITQARRALERLEAQADRPVAVDPEAGLPALEERLL